MQGKVPAIRSVCPLIQVFDMPRSLAFYRDLLGFEIVEKAPQGERTEWAWLARGSCHLELNSMFEASKLPNDEDRGRTRAHGDTVLCFHTHDVGAMCAYLRENGLTVPDPEIGPFFIPQFWVRDPDGYHICFEGSPFKGAKHADFERRIVPP